MLTIKSILSSKNITLKSGSDKGQTDDIRQKMVVIKRINRCCDERRKVNLLQDSKQDRHTELCLLRSTPKHHTAVFGKSE